MKYHIKFQKALALYLQQKVSSIEKILISQAFIIVWYNCFRVKIIHFEYDGRFFEIYDNIYRFKVVCAWCGAHIRGRVENRIISHACCKKCLADITGSL